MIHGSSSYADLRSRVITHVRQIYPEQDADALAERLLQTMGLDRHYSDPGHHRNRWDESDILVITYADSIRQENETPLHTLHDFLTRHLADTVSMVHILPFFPYSSDDGFAVMDYSQVNGSFGDWSDIEHIAGDFKLMSDLVINHCSGRSRWFDQFLRGEPPGSEYFIRVDADTPLADVIRPRTGPLLRKVQRGDGEVHVWCTFSHDQPDLNFRNPDVLIEFVNIIRLYLERGIRIFRLDAVAFLWKQPGTTCLNLPQTHEIVRLLRTLIEWHSGDALIITETNIPNRENLTYFGNANEAHMVYNFSLPPLLLYTLLTGNCHILKNWMMSLPPTITGTTYLNFIASHDGIGLRPIEDLLDHDEIDKLIHCMGRFGGHVSWRALDNDESRPYEINISLFDALKGTLDSDGDADAWQEQRFICAHTIMLALEGIPAFYIHSLFATENDHEKFESTGKVRAINRRNWPRQVLETHLAGDTRHARVFRELKRLIHIRRRQPAFHPNAARFNLHLSDEVFAFWRQGQNHNRDQSIYVLSNISPVAQEIMLTELNLIPSDSWYDLVAGFTLSPDDTSLILKPYQSVWLTNRLPA